MKTLILSILLASTAWSLPKIQKQGIKTEAECIAGGATAATCLPEDTQIYMTSVVPAQKLSTAVTAGLIGGGGGNSGKNYLANAGFEGGNSSWTISGATNAVNTFDFHDGVQALTLTPTGAGSILQSATPAPNLFRTNLESGMWINTTKTDVELCSLSSGSEVECQAVPAVGQWVYIPANMPGPVQGQTIGVKLKWGSTGGSIIVDQGWVGGATNLTKVQQASHTGTSRSAATANCEWSVTASSYTSYSADADCPTPTVTGALLAPDTKIPAFKMNVAAGKIYRITAKGQFNQQGNFIGLFRFSDGTDVSEIAGLGSAVTGTMEGTTGVMTALYKPTTSGLKTIEIQGKSDLGTYATRIHNMSTDLVFEVEEFPSQSQLAVNSLQADYGLTDKGALEVRGSTSDPVKGGIVRDKVWLSKKGEMAHIEYQFHQNSAGSNGSGYYLYKLPAGLNFKSTVLPAPGTLPTATPAAYKVGTAVFHNHSVSADPCDALAYDADEFVIVCKNAWNGSGVYEFGLTNLSFGITIDAPIEGWSTTQNAPTLVGSVTSGSGNAIRIEYASVSDTGTVSSESSDWITGNCTNASPRVCTMPSGLFSIPPICFATGTDSSSTPDTYPTIQSVSTTSFSVMTNNHLPGFSNVTNQRPFNVTCMGPR